MNRLVQLIRLAQINIILMRHEIIRNVLGTQAWYFRWLHFLNPFRFGKQGRTRGESIRIALEELGPIFVKFGQLLSIRRDFLPEDIADELTKLQDSVPPFSSQIAKQSVEKAFRKPLAQIFSRFEETPLASASIAQVHAAELLDGSDVVVKIRRPNIEKIIKRDLAILFQAARFSERFWKQGRRLRPVAVVQEFEQIILDELDLMREAANASQLRRNFILSDKLYIPKIFWNYTHPAVIVMERIYGVPVALISALREKKVNLQKLAESAVEIFFTQVFRDSFFHADMHPGNLFVDTSDPENPKYSAVDFGIMGTLGPEDQHYLAENLLAFFKRDYRRIAVLHVESGWVPPQTRVDQFESAIRTVCEPIFERPLKDISFGLLLLRLFQTAERFHMHIQPQLMLLQKTLFAIEGLGRLLYPQLDLWESAKPYMRKWMRQQKGLKKIAQLSMENWQETLIKIIKTPDLFFDVLELIKKRKQNVSS